MEPRIKDIESLLHLQARDVRFIGIWGMGGIGKTTLAGKVYDRFSSQFEGQCFISNVREKLEKYTLDGLQHEILFKVFGKQNSNVGMPVMLSSSIRNWFMRKKVLIVLDDVSDLGALGFLIGDSAIYAPGSRIVLTSRDKQILKNRCAYIYEVKELNNYETLQLFSLHAFKQQAPTEALINVAKRAMKYTQGVPLALQVLGSSLYSKNVVEWEDQLKKLESSSEKKIQEIMKISYDGLDENEKEIFLDIACFLKSEDKDQVERVLDSLGRFARIGISSLLDKCLIYISDNTLEMHDLIQQMGTDIIRKECIKNPGKRSRLWVPKEIIYVLTKDLGTISVESITLDMSKVRDIELSSNAFERMSKLKFLKFYSPDYEQDISFTRPNKIYDSCKKINISLSEELNFLPDDLTYLHWHKYPSKSLPLNFFPDNLVHLHLMHSHIRQLCNKNKCLVNLRFMNLSYSVDLVKMPDLSELPKLEVLHLRGCASLVQISSSIQSDIKLSHIDLGYCKRLGSIPSFLHLKNLNFLSLEGCSNITDFPKVSRNIRHFFLNRTSIERVSSLIGRHTSLTELSLRKCTRIKLLPDSISELRCLKDLNLNGCSELASLPDNIGKLKRLERLTLNECSKLMYLPDDICNLKSLKHLVIAKCQRLKELPENLGALDSLERLFTTKSGVKRIPSSINDLSKLGILHCDGCEGLILPPFTGLTCLNLLSLEDCGMTEIPNSISSLVSLRKLNLGGNNLEMLPAGFKDLLKLQDLNLRNCKRLKHLSDLPSALEKLFVTNCTLLELLLSHLTKGHMDSLWLIDTRNCANLDQNVCGKIAENMLLRLESISPQLKLYNLLQERQSYTFQEMVPQNPHNVKVYTFRTGLRVVGGEIPPKLMYQNNNGSSLLLSLRPGPHDFMVLAFCAVVAFKDTSFKDCDSLNAIFIRCKCRFMAESGHTLCFEITEQDACFTTDRDACFSTFCHDEMDDIDEVFGLEQPATSDEMFGSEHTRLFYSTVHFIYSKYSFSEASFEFDPVFYLEGLEQLSSSVVVNKCGVHILFDDNKIVPLTNEDSDTLPELPSAWSEFYCMGRYNIQIKEDDEKEGQENY
ncbi:disease resistance protein RPV1-like [Mercurialis annua]|uniref:disease resistance protein RPV1-like n=1 Tax=Mercurialis annua TaxID=3986 RepID=UPI00215E0C03|nr:disease resistance protein RPV1-like [Mercurialis annua]